jgi:hypothetical protein
MSGKLPIENKQNEKFMDCSLLHADEVSAYDINSKIKSENIIERVIKYLSEKEKQNEN